MGVRVSLPLLQCVARYCHGQSLFIYVQFDISISVGCCNYTHVNSLTRLKENHYHLLVFLYRDNAKVPVPDDSRLVNQETHSRLRCNACSKHYRYLRWKRICAPTTHTASCQPHFLLLQSPPGFPSRPLSSLPVRLWRTLIPHGFAPLAL